MESLVGLVDLAPTILDAARIPAPEAFRGNSLLPLVRGGQGVAPRDRSVCRSLS